jgi:hypothetical protein
MNLYRKSYRTFIITLSIFAIATSSLSAQNGFWITADFHIHTSMSDGDDSPSVIAKNAFEKYGLDVISITDHGGHFFRVNKNFLRTDDKGNVFNIGNYDSLMATDAKRFKNYSRSMQLLESFPEIVRLRKQYPDKLIVQGIELNVPGHDHACVGIISETAAPISDFQFVFDRNDTLRAWNNLKKQNANIHKNALAALSYLQNNFADASYFIVNHPSRKMQYTIAEIRDFINAAPQVTVGFEGLPGHQKMTGNRCKYDYELGDKLNYHSKTYGGADYMLAKIGGVWDALLGEGRRFWVFANADYHRASEDNLPGEYAKNYLMVHERSYKSLLDAMRAGNIFAVNGNLIDGLNFSIETKNNNAGMGEILQVPKDSVVTVKISFKVPAEINNRFAKVDHVDLICGDVTGVIPPESSEYNSPVNSSTKIIKKFSCYDVQINEDGLCSISYSFPVSRNQYFRLRGTNVPVNTKNETDEVGNPLCDVLTGKNDEKQAWSDSWFYSNPIFVEVIEKQAEK